MSTPVESNLPYSYPQDVCYGMLKDDIIPAFNVKFGMGYLGYKIQYGSIGLTIIDDDWRAYKLTVKLRSNFVWSTENGLTWGTPLKIYCRSTGPDTTIVEIVADAAKFYDKQVLNWLMDITYKKIPIYSWLVRGMIPNYYFEDTLVLDGKKMKEQSFRDEMWRTALKNIFNRIHLRLEERLQKPAIGD